MILSAISISYILIKSLNRLKIENFIRCYLVFISYQRTAIIDVKRYDKSLNVHGIASK